MTSQRDGYHLRPTSGRGIFENSALNYIPKDLCQGCENDTANRHLFGPDGRVSVHLCERCHQRRQNPRPTLAWALKLVLFAGVSARFIGIGTELIERG